MSVQPRSRSSPAGQYREHQPANLGDILERVLDRGVVIVGDIRISLLDIELLTVKLRLLIASVDTARELGIDWWENDPWLSSRAPRDAVGKAERRRLVEDGDRSVGRVQPRPELVDDERVVLEEDGHVPRRDGRHG